MLKIEMLDDEGAVTEACDAVEVDGECSEDCQDGVRKPVIAWTSAESGIEYAVCRMHLAADQFARLVEYREDVPFAGEIVWDEACGFEHVSGQPCPPHEPIRPEVDPESGKSAFPWFTRNGQEVSAQGWAYGCDCPTCLDRRYANLPRS